MEQTTSNLIGTSATLATLTAAYSGNVTNKIRAKGFNKLQLEIKYSAGVANQFAQVLLETSPDGTNWFIYPTQLASTTENQVYDNEISVPGDRVSVVGTAEVMGAYADLNHEWIRVSARERKNDDTAATVFGSIWVSATMSYDVRN